MLKKKSIKSFLRRYAESIVQIIEDKPLFDFSVPAYKALITLSYFQVGIYLLQFTSDRYFSDLKSSSISNIAQMASLNRLLTFQDNSRVSTVFVLFSQIFLYLYFIYVAIYSIIKYNFSQQYEYLQAHFAKFNQILNMYFCLFISTFLTYQIELSASITFCSPKALFSKDRVDGTPSSFSACNIQSWQLGLGITGIIMCFFTCIICIFFFRNFEFQDQNLMKRKLSTVFVISTTLKATITLIEFSNFTNDNKLLFKHILMQVFGLVSLLDAVFYHPYQHQELAYFNIKITSIFYCLVIIFNIWIYSDALHEDELFYLILVIVVFVEGLFQAIFNYRYEQRMQVDIYQQLEHSSKQTIGMFPFDLYISEIVKLGQLSSKDEESKYRLQRIFSIHLQTCNQDQCYCSTLKIKNQPPVNSDAQQTSQVRNQQNSTTYQQQLLMVNEGRDVDINVVYSIVDSLYNYVLNQKTISDNQFEYEYLSLQYITFIIKCLKNYTRANYLLKVLIQRKLSRGSEFSLYFQIVSSTLTENMEKVIGLMNESFISSKRKEELTIKHIASADQICLEFIPIFKSVVQAKQEMWSKMQAGFQNMNLFQVEALKLMATVKQVKDDFFRRVRQLENERDFNYCLVLKKLKLLFYMFVMNDSITAFQLEEEVIELRKRDAFLEEDCLNNENLIKKNIITITISISQNIGKITSVKDKKTADFFGFSPQEYQKITKVNELMPPFLEKMHDHFLKQFVQRGSSKYIKSSLLTFCRTNRGYIIPIKLHNDFSFISLDDFYVSGTILKVNKGSSFLIFDRSGKILGLSEKLAERLLISSQIMSSLPLAETVIKQLNAFSLIPKVISKLILKKKDILSNYQLQRSEIIQTDNKGCIYFNQNILNDSKEFANYLERNNYTANKEKQKKNEFGFSQRSTLQIDQLDVLHSSSLKKYKQFKRLQESKSLITKPQSKSNSQNQSEYTGMKGTIYTATITSGNNTNHLGKTQLKPSTSFVIQESFKLNFKYILTYHTMPCVQVANQQQKSQRGNQQITTDTSGDNEQRQLFFSLQMDDLQMKENHKQISTLSGASLQEKVADYMKSVSCIPALQKLLQPILNKNVVDQPEEERGAVNRNFQKSRTHLKKHPIPRSFMKFISSGSDSKAGFAFSEKKEIDKAEKLISGKRERKLRRQKTDTEGQSEQHANQSEKSSAVSSSSDEDSETYSLDNSFGEDIYNYKTNEGKNVPLQKKIAEKFSHLSTNLDDVLDHNDITAADMLTVDSYYKAKRVIVSSTESRSFISALEAALVEALIEVKREKLQNNSQIGEQDSEDSQTSIKNQHSTLMRDEPENQITFRKDYSSNNFLASSKQKSHSSSSQARSMFGKQVSDVSGLMVKPRVIVKSTSNSLLEIPEKGQRQDEQENNDKSYSNLYQQDHGSSNIANVSHRLNISQDNLTTHNLNQTQNNYFNVSARPLFNKPKDISTNDYENEIIHTPSSIGGNVSPKKQISFQNEGSTNNMRKSASRKYSFIQNSQLLISNSELRNESKTPNILINSNLNQDLLINNTSSLIDQKKSTQIELNVVNPSFSSNVEEYKLNKSKGTHDQIFYNLLNQGGIAEGGGGVEKNSIHSSSKSSSSYGGYFLKEIIQKAKVPSGAKTYSIMLGLFTLIFLILNITNLLIINSDMQFFAANVVVLRYPRRLLRDYGKTMYGQYLQFQTEAGYFIDTTGSLAKQAMSYTSDGGTSYNGLVETQAAILIQYTIQWQMSSGNYTYDFSSYSDFLENVVSLDTSLYFNNPLYYLIGIQSNQTQNVQDNSYITLRANFFNFGTFITDFVSYLVNNILTTVDNLILKFTFICVAAIISVIIIPIFAVPVAKNINLYEEKILMIVSRINYNHSSVERQKLQICQQLLTLEDYEWLKYSYHEVFGLRYTQFDISIVNSNHDLQQMQSTKRFNFSNDKKSTTRFGSTKITQSKLQSTQEYTKRQQSPSKPNQREKVKATQKNAKQILRNALEGNQQSQRINIFQSTQNKLTGGDLNSSSFRQNQGKDYVLQTKIGDQKLSVIKRILSLLVFMCATIVYFLVVIIYLNKNTSYLKTPVNINKQTNFIHVYATNYILASELLAYDTKMTLRWPQYDLNDLNFFYSTMKSSLNQIMIYQDSLTSIIYGDNPYTSDIVQQMKNIMEGYICSYMVKNTCTGDPNQLTSYGIKSAVSNFARIQTTFPDILLPDDTTDAKLRLYMNSSDRLKTFVNNFLTQDEVFDVFSSTANASIGTVSQGIQQFIQNFLLYCGITLAVIITIVFLFSLSKLYRNIQLTNLFLTFIPEEKLLEEVTLHMLKTLRRM